MTDQSKQKFEPHNLLNSAADQLASLRIEQEKLFSQLQQGERHFRLLARSVWRVQEEERRRLARDLHDGIGQHLTALQHRLEALIGAAEFPSSLLSSASTAMVLCTTALAETRSLSRLLRPQVLDDIGLQAALEWLTRSVSESAKFEVDLDIQNLPAEIDNEMSTLIFRICQEALNNAARHSQAKHLLLRVVYKAQTIQLLIVDDGRGFDAKVGEKTELNFKSSGLSNMRERVRLFGGSFNIVSAPNEGVQVRVLIPLQGSLE